MMGYEYLKVLVGKAVVPECFSDRAIGISGNTAEAISDVKR